MEFEINKSTAGLRLAGESFAKLGLLDSSEWKDGVSESFGEYVAEMTKANGDLDDLFANLKTVCDELEDIDVDAICGKCQVAIESSGQF